jgi:hypothetical protein
MVNIQISLVERQFVLNDCIIQVPLVVKMGNSNFFFVIMYLADRGRIALTTLDKRQISREFSDKVSSDEK